MESIDGGKICYDNKTLDCNTIKFMIASYVAYNRWKMVKATTEKIYSLEKVIPTDESVFVFKTHNGKKQ